MVKMEKTVKKMTFDEAEKEDIEYWKSKTPQEKLEALQNLREVYYKFKNESRKGFQRVYRIIKQE